MADAPQAHRLALLSAGGRWRTGPDLRAIRADQDGMSFTVAAAFALAAVAAVERLRQLEASARFLGSVAAAKNAHARKEG